jgi:hypothetical protein
VSIFFNRGHLSNDDIKRSIRRLSKPYLKAYIQRITPEIKYEILEEVVEEMKQQLAIDPLALLQEVKSGEDNAQLRVMKGFNLEIALFLAGLTGAFVYTDMKLHWKHLHEHTIASSAENVSLWSSVTEAIKGKLLPIQHDPTKQINDRYSGNNTSPIRKIISRIFTLILNDNKPATVLPMIFALDGYIKRLRENQALDWPFEAKFDISVPPAGFENNAIRRLIFTYGRTNDVRIPQLAIYVQFFNAGKEIESDLSQQNKKPNLY